MKRLASIALLLFLPSAVVAKIVIYDFDARVRQSNLIVEAVAIRVSHKLLARDLACFEPRSILKGGVTASEVCVRFGNRLFSAREDSSSFRAGATYILFLTQEDDAYELVGAHQGYCEVNGPADVLCDGVKSTRESFLERVRKAIGNGGAQ